MSKIEHLTTEQEARLAAFREEWLAVGRATGPPNLDIVTPILERWYARIGKPAPVVVRATSPMVAQLAINLLNAPSLRASLGASLRASLGDSLRDSLWDSLRASLGDSLGDSLRDAKLQYASTYFWGSYDAYWVAFYLFAQRVLKPDIYAPEDLALLEDWARIVQHSGWIYPFENICFVCDRPESYALDERGRLHSESGMAMRFSDGYGIYAIHGIRVDERLIMRPETITLSEIQNERNAEIRRIMIDRRGRDWFLRESGATVIDQNAWFGTLYRAGRDGCWLEVTNRTPEVDGTFKRYILAIDPNAYRGDAGRYAHAAVASTFCFDDGTRAFRDWRDYQPTSES